jgi:uncharacterized protein YbaR (Trm112 family)
LNERARPSAEPRYLVDPRVLEMLVCPLTKTRLTLSADRTELVSGAAHLAFPIKQGVPMLSLDEARDMDPDEMKAFTARGEHHD